VRAGAFILIATVLGCAGALRAAELNVFAAASLSDALREIATTYEAKSGDKLRFNLGASSLLARQIREGAPADVFFSADELKMDELASAGLIVAETRRVILSNTLVIIVAAEGGAAVSQPADLKGSSVRRLALGETKTVPAGIYAREYLLRAGLWEAVAPKVVALENVRAALAAVESGNAEAGIVYRTDALISKKVRIAYEVPLNEGPRISYPLAVVRDSRRREEALRFVAYVQSPDASAVFRKFGFLVVP
jgi:molybdate transport system substrate-binding protein